MTEHRTTKELLQEGLITDAEVDAAINAALDAAAFSLNGYTLDLVSALVKPPSALGYLADPRKNEAFRRQLIRDAILSACPLKDGPPPVA